MSVKKKNRSVGGENTPAVPTGRTGANPQTITVICIGVVLLSAAAAVVIPTLGGAAGGGLRGTSTSGGDVAELKFLQWPADAKLVADSDLVGLVKHRSSPKTGGSSSFYALQARGDIRVNQSLLSIPYSSCLSVGQAVDDAVLGPALAEVKDLLTESAAPMNPAESSEGKKTISLFDQSLPPTEAEAVRGILPITTTRWTFEQFALVSYILRQKALGDSSFWAPWLGQTTAPGQPPSNDYSWSWKTSKKCVNVPLKDTMDQSLRYLGRVLKAVVMASSKSPAYASAVFGSTRVAESHKQDPSVLLEHVRWALSLIRTRGWEQPAPIHMLLVPVLDLVDTRSGAVKPWDTAGQSSVTPTSSRKSASKGKEDELAAGVVIVPLFDHETGHVHIVSAPSLLSAGSRSIKKGTYLSTSYDGGSQRRVVQDSLRYYGTVTEINNGSDRSISSLSTAALVDSYWDFEASLKSAFVLHHRQAASQAGGNVEAVKAEMDEKMRTFLAALQAEQPQTFDDCSRRSGRLFLGFNGEPTPEMMSCLNLVSGATNALAIGTGGSGGATSSIDIWKGHAKKVLENIHTSELRGSCASYVESGVRLQQPNMGGTSSATGKKAASLRRTMMEQFRGASDLLRMEEILAAAFGRVLGIQ